MISNVSITYLQSLSEIYGVDLQDLLVIIGYGADGVSVRLSTPEGVTPSAQDIVEATKVIQEVWYALLRSKKKTDGSGGSDDGKKNT